MIKNFLQIWKILKPFHTPITALTILLIVLGFAESAFNIFYGYIIDGLTKYDINSFFYWFVLYIIFTFTYWTMDYIFDYQYQKRVPRKVSQYLQEYSINKIFSFNISQTLENNSAIRQDIVNIGENSIVKSIRIIMSILFIIAVLIFSIGTIFYYSIIFGIFTLFSFVLLFCWESWFNKYYTPIRDKLVEIWVSQKKIKQESFTHVSVIKSLGQESSFIKRYIKERGEKTEYSIEKDLIYERHNGRRNYVLSFLYITAFALLAHVFFNKEVSIAILMILSSNINMGLHWTKRLYWEIDALIQEHSNIKKYLDFVNLKQDFDENGQNLKFKNGNIEFRDFSFTYPQKKQLITNGSLDDNKTLEDVIEGDSKTVINKINLTIKENSKVAFVGHSGSGKSTIIKILLKYYQYSDDKNSKVTIDDLDLKDINAIDLRQNIGYVEQYVDLFDDTLKNNILFGLKIEEIDKMTEDEIKNRLEEVSKLAKIDAFYDRLGEKKFDTLLGEKGLKLSGGERQRVGIARAIIRNPKILILDEATASLDTINENYIRHAIKEVSKGKTTIIIAHRLSTVMDSDKIFVMEKGQIVGEGTHAELLKNNKYYQDLIAGQELI